FEVAPYESLALTLKGSGTAGSNLKDKLSIDFSQVSEKLVVIADENGTVDPNGFAPISWSDFELFEMNGKPLDVGDVYIKGTGNSDDIKIYFTSVKFGSHTEDDISFNTAVVDALGGNDKVRSISALHPAR